MSALTRVGHEQEGARRPSSLLRLQTVNVLGQKKNFDTRERFGIVIRVHVAALNLVSLAPDRHIRWAVRPYRHPSINCFNYVLDRKYTVVFLESSVRSGRTVPTLRSCT